MAAGAASAASVRQPDVAFEALCRVCGIDWSELTTSERSRVNAALAQIRKAWSGTHDGLATEIARRSAHFRQAWDVALTPMALAGRWAQSAHPPTRGQGLHLNGSDRGVPAIAAWAAQREGR